MITTNKRTIGLCTACHERKHLAALTGTLVGLCTRCYDMAGDDNAVSDGHMTCADFKARYGEHSQYCDCAAAQPDQSAMDAALAAYTASRIALTDAHTALLNRATADACKGTGYAHEIEASARALRDAITRQDEDACRIFGTSVVFDALRTAIEARAAR
jgi:hypothetical protein